MIPFCQDLGNRAAASFEGFARLGRDDQSFLMSDKTFLYSGYILELSSKASNKSSTPIDS